MASHNIKPHMHEVISPWDLQESLSSPIDRRSDYYRHTAREQQPHSQAVANAKPQSLLTAPNVLTLLRLLMVPVLVVLWFLPHRLAPLASALTFILAAITDWADGYLARRVCSLARDAFTQEAPAVLSTIRDIDFTGQGSKQCSRQAHSRRKSAAL